MKKPLKINLHLRRCTMFGIFVIENTALCWAAIYGVESVLPAKRSATTSAHSFYARAEVTAHGNNWDRCYDFLNIFAEKFSKKIGVLDTKQS
jgi:hypothetical protein